MKLGGSASRPAGHTIGVADSAASGLDLETSPQPGNFDPADLELDDWLLDHDFPELAGAAAPPSSTAVPPAWSPGVSPLSAVDSWFVAAPAVARPPAPQPAAGRSVGFGAMFIALGLMALVCGLALLLGATLTGHDMLWSLGLPIAVGGQVVLLLGLALQVELVGQRNRVAADKLQQVDQQLHNLEQAAARLGTTHSSAAQAFYAHMAEGANPQLLLADVKSQLDLLALRMSQRS